MDGGARPAPSQKRPHPADGELVELLWQNGAVVAQAQARHRRGLACAAGGDTGASSVTGETAPAPPAWVPGGVGALGGDVYSQLWRSIARVDDGDVAVPSPPPAASGARSSWTAAEAGSSFCGSNVVTAAPAPYADRDAAPPAAADAPGASKSRSGWGSSVPLKRGRDEFDSRGEDTDFDTVDETRPSQRPASKRRTRAAEVHNLSERRRRDRINEKMRALQELVPHCNKTDKASILDEAIEYLKSLQLQVQIMWMTTGMAPMMPPGANQIMSPMAMGFNLPCMPAAQGVNQMQRTAPFMNNTLLNQMPQLLSPVLNVANPVQNQGNHIGKPRNPFVHNNDAVTATSTQVPNLFCYGSEMAEQNEIQELLAGTAAPALEAEPPSSSDGTGT